MPQSPLFVSLIPMNTIWLDWYRNVSLMMQLGEAQVDRFRGGLPTVPLSRLVLVYPELCLTGFVTESPEKHSVPMESEQVESTVQRLQTLETGFVCGFPRAHAESDRPRNTTVLVHPDEGGQLSYDKLHLFTQGLPPEADTYDPGDEAAVGWYEDWRVGLATCFDLRFSGMFEAMANHEVDVVFATANWVAGPGKSAQLDALASGHAVAMQAYVVVVNRIGSDPAFAYSGDAKVFTPLGGVLESPGPIRLDPGLLAEARRMKVRDSRRNHIPVGDWARRGRS